MMQRIIVLSTDTLHHRYFINSLIGNGIKIECCIFETESVQPNFKTGPLFDDEENTYEAQNFFKELSPELNNVDIKLTQNINSQKAVEIMSHPAPDLGVVFGTRQLNIKVLNLFRDGLVNVHRGISQEYRGLDSDLWAIYHNDYDNLGVTIHKVIAELDKGEIVFQEKMRLKQDMKIYQIRYYTTLIAAELVIKAVGQYLRSGELPSYPQPQEGRYYSFMPIELKRVVAEKFNKYCESYHA